GGEIKPVLILSITYILAFLMVSNIRYRSFKNLNLRDRKPFSALIGIILFIIVLSTYPQITLFLVFFLYALSGVMERPLRALFNRFRKPVEAGELPLDAVDDIEDKEIFLKS
ncbi:MAG TPA: hypothetical protein VFG95_04520, partial [Nitrospiria bacterium]|nr:hypothetical protein [Nitrospiria bacterium]